MPNLRAPTPEDRPRIVDRLRRMVRRWPAVSGYHLNPDDTIVEGIVQSLTRSTMDHGVPYCPCRDLTGDRTIDRRNICPCEHHHAEIARDSFCRCVLFVGDDYTPEKAYSPIIDDDGLETIRSVRQRDVTVYSTSWCYMSRRAFGLLEKRDVPFENIDIERDKAAAQQVEAWNNGTRSVPTIVAHVVLTEPRTRELESILMAPKATVLGLTAHVTSWCAQSRRTLAWLKERDIQVDVIDIERDEAAAAQVEAWNGGDRSVPTLAVRLLVTEPLNSELEQLLGLRVG